VLCTVALLALRKPVEISWAKECVSQTARFPLDWGGDYRYSHFGCLWLRNGDWENFVQQWQTSRFIHVMSLDFTFLPIVSSTLGDDMARRSEKFSVVLADGIDTAFRSPDLSVCPPPQQLVQKYPALQHQPQTRSQEQTKLWAGKLHVVVMGRIYYLCLAAGSSASPTGNIDVTKNLLTGQWADINPIILSFALVGIGS